MSAWFGDIFYMVCRRLCVAQVPQSMQVSKGPSAQAEVADEAIVSVMEPFDVMAAVVQASHSVGFGAQI